MLGLYLHIPFCQAICGYCNFNRGLLDADLKARYVRALAREIQAAGDRRVADTIFFGGGTPSLLEPGEVGGLITTCREAYQVAPGAEITLEANPESATMARLAGYRAAGVNRLSLGVQSFDDGQLARLGRLHSSARAADAVREARAAGFDNVSLDLMFWLPGQSRVSWRATVDRAIDLAPDHLSFYMLELYPNAPLKEAIARHRRPGGSSAGTVSGADWEQAADDEAADMYLEGLERLDQAGYVQYEISNVSRPGHESRHNQKYWTMGSWRGFGCGAHSTVDAVRWRNISSTVDYVERIAGGGDVRLDCRELSRAEQEEEALFTGLRLTSGLDAARHAAQFGRSPWDAYGENLAQYLEAGLLWSSGTRFGLTRSGMLVSNEILAVFV